MLRVAAAAPHFVLSLLLAVAGLRLRGMSGIRELAEAYASEAEGTGDPYADFATAWVLRRVYGFGPDELARRAWALIEGNR